MPMMKESWRKARMKLIDRLVQDAAARRPGPSTSPPGGLFVDPGGGHDAKWRLADGVHFTVEGQQRLAVAVFKDIERDWLPGALPSSGHSPAASSPTSAGPAV